MLVSCSKLDAATRQLDVAIALHFSGSDPLAVRTLAAASFALFADLAEAKEKGSSWRSALIEDSGLGHRDALSIIRKAQNFLKHADRDSHESFSFEESENDHVIFFATNECVALGQPLSLRMQVFQIWFLAVHPDALGRDKAPVKESLVKFPELSLQPRSQQISVGNQFLSRVLEEHTNS